MKPHFLQSTAWETFQQALGRTTHRLSGASWAALAVEQSVRGIKYWYVPYGPSGELKTALAELKAQCKADFLRFEPTGEFDGKGFVRSGEVQPEYTWQLDLTQEIEKIRTELNSGHRNRINGAVRKDITCRTSSDPTEIETFLGMLHDTAARARFSAHPDSYFRAMAQTLMPLGAMHLYFAEVEGQIAAGAIGYDWDGVRYYAHAAANQELNRKVGAAVVLVWYMITGAKELGMTTFDFWGVEPGDDPNHKWHGLSQFKKGFGGHLVTYGGTWDLPINKLKYQAYKLAKRVLR